MTTQGLVLAPGRLGRPAQEALHAAVMAGAALAPLAVRRMPRTGQPMRVRQTNFGPLGWVTDQTKGYRYEPCCPETGAPWPPIPQPLLDLWAEFAPAAPPPEACLVNVYDAHARMGLHVDADEAATAAPVLSVSLGDTAVFRIGGPSRRDPTRTLRLASGDVLVMAGPARRAYHGVDRIIPGSSTLLPGGGRISLTLRRVNLG